MPSVQIQLLSGPGAGRRAVFSSPPITFGRDADNTLVLAEAFVSRRHGEIRLDGDQWLLVNQSVNGTTVSGRKVTDKPRRLRDGDVVAIGGQSVFQVDLVADAPAAGAAPVTEGAPHAAAASPPSRKRHKVWIGIGVYLLVMVGLIVFFSTLGKRAITSGPTTPELTGKQIEDEIRQPLPRQTPNATRARECLETATEQFNKRESAPDALFRAYRAYQEALAYSETERLDSMDHLRLEAARKELIQEVRRRYAAAYAKLRSNQYEEAKNAFAALAQFYNPTAGPTARASRIYDNVQAHLKYAIGHLQKGRL